MAEKISIQIELVGGDEVAKQLADIGAAGEKAFEQINKASDQVGAGMSQTGAAADKTSESVSKLSQETEKSSGAVDKIVEALQKLAQALVQTASDHEVLIASLLKLRTAFSLTSRVVSAFTPELALVGVTAGSTAAAVAAGVVAFEAAEKVVTKFAASSEKLNHTLQTLAATSGESFNKLQDGQAAFEQIGIKAETFRSTIAKINETLAGTEVTNLTKGMRDVVELVNQIAAGDKGITFADWVTAEDKIKGVSIAMKQAADAGKNATQVLLEFLRSADLATSIKVGAAFGLSEADVDRVRRLNENVSDLVQRIQGAGPLISPEAAASFDAMRTSIQNADSAWVRFKQAIDSTIFPSIAANFSQTMHDMEAAAVNGAARIVEALNQAGRSFATPPPEFTAALTFAGQQLQNAVTGLNSIVASIVGAVAQQAGASAQQIQALKDQINGVTQEAQNAGQAAQTAGLIFTQWGTVAGEATNTAKAGAEQVTTMFTSFGTVASQSGDKAKASMEQAAGATQSMSDKVAAFISQITGISWDTISGAGVAAWNAITAAIQGAIDKLLQFIGLKPSAPATGGSAPGKASGGLLGGRGTGTSDSNLAWVSRGEHIMPAAVVRQPGVLAFLEALRRGGSLPRFADGGSVGGSSGALGGLINELGGAIGTVKQIWEGLLDGMQGVYQTLNQAFTQVIQQSDQVVRTTVEQLKKLQITLAVTLGHLVNAMQGNASGGLLGGRGTGTSDSNLAWVSRGEYITPARAVVQPGVLEFLEALRRSGGNLRGVLDGMGRFALGGMIPRPAMAFTGGGMVGGHLGTLTLGLPSGGSVTVRASAGVADELRREAALAQVRSGGRKPSRYS